MQGSCGGRSKFLQVNQDHLLSLGMLMTNECRSNPQLPNALSCIFKFFFPSLSYPKCLPEMTSIKSVGALFVEDNGPHHVVTFGGRTPTDFQQVLLGGRWCLLAQPRLWGWTKARASCSANPSEIGVNSGSFVWSGPDFKHWDFFSPFFLLFYSISKDF